jgi:mono/diheme cytochrome c family protein
MSERMLQGSASQPVKGTSEAEEKHQIDPAALVGPVAREMAEPTDGLAPTPVGLVLFFFLLAGMAGYYLARNSGGFAADIYDEHYTQGASSSEPTKPVDPMVLGRRTFNLCAQCHQDNGGGLAGTYPPLAGSEIVAGDVATLSRILLHGLHGDVTVAGATYNGQMPGWDRLSDVQIASVLTYVRSTWGNNAPPVDPALVTQIRAETSGRTQAWTWAELQRAAEAPSK